MPAKNIDAIFFGTTTGDGGKVVTSFLLIREREREAGRKQTTDNKHTQRNIAN